MAHEDVRRGIDLALGDHAGDFDTAGIAAVLIREYGPLDSIDDVPEVDFWSVVVEHEYTVED